jgi:heat-inducible transcriptional repressor
MSTDAPDLPELTERQERILSIIVREYTNKPEPVGSKYLAEQHLASLSSATIRNDMARLEELGLLAAPHTSAGRIPTEMGYRYFVKRLLAESERQLPIEEKRAIAEQFRNVPENPDGWLRVAVVALARTAQSAAVVTPPVSITRRRSQFKHLALIGTQGRLVMMVLVLQGGDVRQQMLTLAEFVPQDALSAIAHQLNTHCEGLTGEQIRARPAENGLEREVADLVADTLDDADRAPFVYREGLMDMLRDFTERQSAEQALQQALRLTEESKALNALLTEPAEHEIGQVRVVIAGDGRHEQVRHLGIVLGHYGVEGHVVGTMAVLGPTRMRYGRAISTVSYIAGLVSSMMANVYINRRRDEAGRADLTATD